MRCGCCRQEGARHPWGSAAAAATGGGEFLSAAWTVFRAGVRRRWRAWVALALLIGLFAAVVTALAAGARRTDSAYPRLLTWSSAPALMFYTSDRESVA